MTICLSALEIAHMAFLGTWNSEIFAAITGLTGTVTGIFVGQKV
jgi:acetylglutamate kinase